MGIQAASQTARAIGPKCVTLRDDNVELKDGDILAVHYHTQGWKGDPGERGSGHLRAEHHVLTLLSVEEETSGGAKYLGSIATGEQDDPGDYDYAFWVEQPLTEGDSICLVTKGKLEYWQLDADGWRYTGT